ncbi:MAG TPA: PD-(D/E)XK nuclease family protein, partial [Vicinamibacterales bacterium]|nr:PD-(D/E)XK nuclease family protein [Vicinamibacterales bacterium]
AIAAAPVTTSTADDFAPLALARTGASNVSDMARAAAPATASGTGSDRDSARAFGALIHRAVAAGALAVGDDVRDEVVTRLAAGLDGETCNQARTALARLAARDDVREIITEAEVDYEVPLSWQAPDGSTVRAVLDAVARHKDGRIAVVEFKTGRAREADERQLADYVAGLGRLLRGKIVSGRLIRLDS